MPDNSENGGGGMGYGRFAAMIATSTVVMFGLMYLNTYLVTHVFWSQTRAWMALVMGAAMAIVMLLFMLSMYPSRRINIAILAGAAIVFGGALWLVRSQVTVGDLAYMRAMIPHHSIAVMTSTRADISDPRVRALADSIIHAQDKEIAEMRYLIDQIAANGDASPAETDPLPAIVSLDEAISSPALSTLDLEFLTEADMAQLFPDGAACTFAYTTDSRPVLAVGDDGAALARLSGDLVRLDATDPSRVTTGPDFRTGELSLDIRSAGDGGALDAAETGPRSADLRLSLGAGLEAGYQGYYSCLP